MLDSKSIKSLYSSTAFLSLATLFDKLSGFILIPILTAVLTVSAFGQLMTAVSLVGLFSLFIYNGLHSALFRWYASWTFTWDKRVYEKYIILSTGVIAFFWIFVLIFTNSFIPLTPILSVDFWLFLAVLISSVVLIPYTLKLNSWIIDGKSSYALWFTIAKSILVIFSVWFALKFYPLAITKPTVEICVIGCLSTILLYYTYSKGPALNTVPSTEIKRILKQSFLYGWATQGTQISYWFISSSDRFILNHLLGSDAVGIYAIAMLGTIPIFIISSFISSFSSQFFKMYEDKINLMILNNIVGKYLLKGLLIIIAYKLFIILCSGWLIKNIISDSYITATGIMYYTPDILFFYFSHLMITRYFHVKLKVNIIIYSMAFASMVNIGLNYILIPILGIHGAIYSSVTAFFIMSTLSLLFLIKIIGITLSREILINYTVGTFILLIINFLVTFYE